MAFTHIVSQLYLAVFYPKSKCQNHTYDHPNMLPISATNQELDTKLDTLIWHLFASELSTFQQCFTSV